MSAQLLSGLITALILVPIFLLIAFLIFKKIVGMMIKLILLLIILGVFFFGWRYGKGLIFDELANLFPDMKGVTCFVLSEENCLKRPDCQQGIGANDKHCVPKLGTLPDETKLIEKVEEEIEDQLLP